MVNPNKNRPVAAPAAKPKSRAWAKKVFASKVYRHYLQPKSNSSSERGRIKQGPPVPWIQLQGYWLGQIGFPVDVELTVEATMGCITLKPKLPLKK